MSTLRATRLFSIFVLCLLGTAILLDGLTEADDAVASPLVGAIFFISGILIFILPRILS